MNNRIGNALKSLTLAAGLIGAASLLSSSPAEAHSVHARHGHVVARGHHAVRPFVAPRHIAFRTVRTFDPFFSRRVFFGPHRHFHSVYLFPVVSSYGTVYEPYTYCGDDLFADPHGFVTFRGPRVSFSIGF